MPTINNLQDFQEPPQLQRLKYNNSRKVHSKNSNYRSTNIQNKLNNISNNKKPQSKSLINNLNYQPNNKQNNLNNNKKLPPKSIINNLNLSESQLELQNLPSLYNIEDQVNDLDPISWDDVLSNAIKEADKLLLNVNQLLNKKNTLYKQYPEKSKDEIENLELYKKIDKKVNNIWKKRYFY